MPRKWFLIILAIVIIPVSMISSKIMEYAHENKQQVSELHRHIVHALSLNTAAYFQQLNTRLAFAPLLARSPAWGEQINILNNALLANNDFAGAALLDAAGHEKAKAFDTKLEFLRQGWDYSLNPLFQKHIHAPAADTGPVYQREGISFFDVIYPLENGDWLVVVVRWEALKNLLFDQQVGQEGYIWVLEESGRVIGDSKDRHYGQVTLPAWTFFQDRLDDPASWQGEFNDPQGVESVGAGEWIQSAGWFVMSVQPQAEAYAKIKQLRRKAILWVVMSVLGMGLFAYFWVAHISHPITRLAKAVSQVAARRFDERVPENFGLEEFRALGRAFNQMTQELKVYNELQVEKIIDEKTKVESLLFSILDGIVMIDDRGQLLFANAPAKQWVQDVAGRGKEADFLKAWDSLGEYPPWNDLLRPVLEKEKATGTEEFEFPVQGRKRWARVLAQEVMTDTKRRLGIMVVIRDITQDKELDRMKEDFFNGITHDLRTPLAATIGYIGLSEMQLPAGDKELATLVGSARQSAKRALSLVETILSLARLQAGKLNMDLAPVQVQGLLKKIVNDLGYQALAKKMTLTFECDDASLWIHADGSLLERVIENLTGNAIKYTMEKGWVKIIAKAVATGVEIAITDNGRGIPKEAAAKLFGKFQQVKAEDRAVGFGIGLAFSQGIVEAHGSHIEVESEVGKGSKFFFVIDRIAAPAANALLIPKAA
jgi:signal transduction histidine kinase/HAMP domain-containing protein